MRALLVGHSHYDHMGDLVPVARGYARNAAIYVNPTGRHMLAPYSDLAARSKALDPHSNEWIWLRDDDDNPLPIRFRAIASDHAPHSRFFRFAHRQLTEDWTQEWSEIPIRRFVDGRMLAFVIELRDEDLATVRFQIHYQDAASGPPAGYDGLSAGLEIDLAVLCLPSAHLVEGYPEQLLAHLRVRHAMVTHYEDFFSQRDDTRFVGALTDARAASFLAAVKAAADRQPDASSGPLAVRMRPVCRRLVDAVPRRALALRAAALGQSRFGHIRRRSISGGKGSVESRSRPVSVRGACLTRVPRRAYIAASPSRSKNPDHSISRFDVAGAAGND